MLQTSGYTLDIMKQAACAATHHTRCSPASAANSLLDPRDVQSAMQRGIYDLHHTSPAAA